MNSSQTKSAADTVGKLTYEGDSILGLPQAQDLRDMLPRQVQGHFMDIYINYRLLRDLTKAGGDLGSIIHSSETYGSAERLHLAATYPRLEDIRAYFDDYRSLRQSLLLVPYLVTGRNGYLCLMTKPECERKVREFGPRVLSNIETPLLYTDEFAAIRATMKQMMANMKVLNQVSAIGINVSADRGQSIVSVSDQVEGLSKEELPSMFLEGGYRLVKRIIGLCNGSIQVKTKKAAPRDGLRYDPFSNKIGSEWFPDPQGTTVTMRFPNRLSSL
jgi:hypothetical protein